MIIHVLQTSMLTQHSTTRGIWIIENEDKTTRDVEYVQIKSTWIYFRLFIIVKREEVHSNFVAELRLGGLNRIITVDSQINLAEKFFSLESWSYWNNLSRITIEILQFRAEWATCFTILSGIVLEEQVWGKWGAEWLNFEFWNFFEGQWGMCL